MKKVSMIVTAFLLLTACTNKTHDVPSLDEQKEGRWQIRSYTNERYQPVINTVINQEYLCGEKDYMHFTQDKVAIHFDSISTIQLACTIFDHNTLLIEGKKWDIIKLDPNNFHLSLFDRDSSKNKVEVVRFALVRN